MHTRVTKMLGIDFPILAFTHCRDVAAAVTNAGGLGVLGAVAHTPGQLDIDLKWIAEQTKGRPFGVDLLIPSKYVGAEAGGFDPASLRSMVPDAHREWIEAVLERYSVPPLPPSTENERDQRGMAGLRIDPKSMGPLIEVAFDHKVALIASALGTPPRWLVDKAHARGIPVAALAGRIDHALAHKEGGVDFVIAQGTEGGGHTGEIATMVLIPQVVDAVAPLPVLAAGGIASGRQMAAAMALGAEGVWCGSVWLTTHEAETTPAIREKFLAATSADTRRSRSLTGKPARMLRSAWTDAWDEPGAPAPLAMPLQSMLVADAQRRIQRVAHKADSSARPLVTYFVGQVVGQMNVAMSTRDVVREMVEGCLDAMERMNGLLAGE
ncbi:MAG: nitronate monooxygenase [Deltaproteobacteria bacterium]|nr:nitronate monooxygenase [Deltaproteobacteria bacterium]MBI3387103.1 nitronate monooxygenase [Deltaproteobacteria bacterium]